MRAEAMTSDGAQFAWASLTSDERRALIDRIVALHPDTDPAERWDAMRPDDQRHMLYLLAHPQVTGDHERDVARVAAGVDPAAVAAWDRRKALRELSALANGWPELDPAALYGLPGEVVAVIGPHTEADPVGLLLTFLTMFGVSVGLRPYAYADGAKHRACLNVVLVGDTAKARKGTGYRHVRHVFALADSVLVDNYTVGGFGSGEAFVDEVASEEHGDHRRLVVEPEWARVLTAAGRDGSVLSPLIRQAWDGDRLEARSRGKKSVAEGAHIGVVGHITADELRARLLNVEVANGFANRHLFALVHRAQLLPDGGAPDDDTVRQLGDTVGEVLVRARNLDRVHRDSEAEARWDVLYRAMAADEPGGLLGAVTARDQAQLLRLSLVYALTHGSGVVGLAHLEAAWAVWRYCRASAAVIFGDSLGDEVADTILAAVRDVGAGGITYGELQRRFFANHLAEKRRERAVALLVDRGLIRRESESTDGRPRAVLYPCEGF
jgi:hypothetical protein